VSVVLVGLLVGGWLVGRFKRGYEVKKKSCHGLAERRDAEFLPLKDDEQS